jgi:fructose-1,6-bisphosphatase I
MSAPQAGERGGLKLEEFLRLNAPEDLAALTTAVAKASITVWDGIPFRSGLLKEVNPSGDTQKAIDVYSNDVYTEALTSTGYAGEVASEEMEEPVQAKGEVSVAMDPLDGSSNVETNNPLGSIFGFYRKPLPTSGRDLGGSLYVTYGNVITLTLSFGKGVHRFVALREGAAMNFELLEVNLKLPEKPEVYGIGGSRREWVPQVRTFVDSMEERGMKERYCGTFVGDYNQVLARGGIFAYPATVTKPQGKLRVLYETAPMAFLNEQAGGYGSDGSQNILDITPMGLADTSPAYIGNSLLVKELEKMVSSAL